jgi:hypothetical protein
MTKEQALAKMIRLFGRGSSTIDRKPLYEGISMKLPNDEPRYLVCTPRPNEKFGNGHSWEEAIHNVRDNFRE